MTSCHGLACFLGCPGCIVVAHKGMTGVHKNYGHAMPARRYNIEVANLDVNVLASLYHHKLGHLTDLAEMQAPVAGNW